MFRSTKKRAQRESRKEHIRPCEQVENLGDAEDGEGTFEGEGDPAQNAGHGSQGGAPKVLLMK